jgi:hypothetical protein
MRGVKTLFCAAVIALVTMTPPGLQPPSFLDGTWKPPAVGRVPVTP